MWTNYGVWPKARTWRLMMCCCATALKNSPTICSLRNARRSPSRLSTPWTVTCCWATPKTGCRSIASGSTWCAFTPDDEPAFISPVYGGLLRQRRLQCQRPGAVHQHGLSQRRARWHSTFVHRAARADRAAAGRRRRARAASAPRRRLQSRASRRQRRTIQPRNHRRRRPICCTRTTVISRTPTTICRRGCAITKRTSSSAQTCALIDRRDWRVRPCSAARSVSTT